LLGKDGENRKALLRKNLEKRLENIPYKPKKIDNLKENIS